MKKNLVNVSLSAGVLATALFVGACETTTPTNSTTSASPVASGTVVVVSSPVPTPEVPKFDAKASMATITTELGKAASAVKAKDMTVAGTAVSAAGAEAMKVASMGDAQKTALKPVTDAIDKAKIAVGKKDAPGLTAALNTATAAAGKIDVTKWPATGSVMGAVGAMGDAAKTAASVTVDKTKEAAHATGTAMKEGANKAADATKAAADKANDAMKAKATPTPTPKKN